MARSRAPPLADDQMATRPDDVTSSNAFVKSDPDIIPSSVPSHDVNVHDDHDGVDYDDNDNDNDNDDDDDPVIRTIDVYISPALSSTLHLLQFPIQPAVNKRNAHHHHHHRSNGQDNRANTPADARFRPKHNMLELDYPIPPSAQAAQRQLPDTMCLSQRTFASNAIAPVTHMALARLNRSGERLNVVPLTKSVMQMRPSFRHLHDPDDDGDPNAAGPNNDAMPSGTGKAGRVRPVMFQKKETERTVAQRRNSYAYKRAAEEGEEWIELDVHGSVGKWTPLRKEVMAKIKCTDRENELRFKTNLKHEDCEDGGYVKSLNYLDALSLQARSGVSGEGFVENLSEWSPSSAAEDAAVGDDGGENAEEQEDADDIMDADDMRSLSSNTSAAPPAVGAIERATAELASKLAVLLQTGNGTMIPYRVLRSRFNPAKVSDELLTMALSSCAVLVRGNFSLKSDLCKFLHLAGAGLGTGGAEERKKRLRELRDLILLLLNMHGAVQRERLTWAYAVRAEAYRSYEAIHPDVITFVLRTVAKRSEDCWVAKVEDDEQFGADFPEVAASHGAYWFQKKDMLMDLIELYENAEVGDHGAGDHLCPSILDNSV